MYITAQGPRLRNDLYCVEWDVKLYYAIPCWALKEVCALLSAVLILNLIFDASIDQSAKVKISVKIIFPTCVGHYNT